MDKKLVRKRKSQEIPSTNKLHHQLSLNNDQLNLSLSPSFTDMNPNNNQATPPLLLLPPQQPNNNNGGSSSARGRRPAATSSSRSRSERGRQRAIIKTNTITPPFSWATDRRATVHSMEYLVSQGITTITGDVQCKRCDQIFSIEYNVEEKFRELVYYILDEGDMRHRAPEEWLEPALPNCKYCGVQDICKPLISDKKRCINWLFLLLGQLLGCCTLEQLKYFCKHTHNHRTGAKDRVLFLSYYTLCKQLDPNVPINL